MDFTLLALAVRTMAQLLILLVFITSILSFFMSPYHPVKQSLDRLVSPLLEPIRRVIPPAGMFDFSPLIFIVLIDVLQRIIVSILIR